MEEERVERKAFLDVARIFAVCLVVLAHVAARYVVEYESNTLGFFFGNLFDSISRTCVPVFVMISGALLLDENKRVTGKSMLKRIKNVALLLAFWSFAYVLFDSIFLPLVKSEKLPSVQEMIYNFFMGHIHLWYLYMVIGLYAITPFLRAFVKKENKSMVLVFLLLSTLGCFLPGLLSLFYGWFPELSYAVQFINKFELDFFCGYAAYYVLGWYIVRIGFTNEQKIAVYIASGLALAGMFLAAQFIPAYGGESTAFRQAYANNGLLLFLYSAGVFTFLASLEGKLRPSEKTSKWLKAGSKLSFGVYVLHMMVLSAVYKVLGFIPLPPVTILAVWVVTTAVSFAACFVLSKIPFLKNLIRL